MLINIQKRFQALFSMSKPPKRNIPNHHSSVFPSSTSFLAKAAEDDTILGEGPVRTEACPYQPEKPIPSFFPIIALIFASTQFRINRRWRNFRSRIRERPQLNFTKDILIQEAVSSILPLRLPPIEKDVRVAVVGIVQIILSDISVNKVSVGSSNVKTGDGGDTIVFIASGATANLSMSWSYSYRTMSVHLPISDSGEATVQIMNGLNGLFPLGMLSG